ncbi:MAG TPA: hypothetical protein DCP17_10035, partial [Ruminococcaceae bacterium]|nr:hypothetical protein [Oscillospiraceae bacterium]
MSEFMLGCNYWASHAGAEMWKNWDEEQVERDMQDLSEYGVKYLRVFPNWKDFQPVMPVYGGEGRIKEYMLEGCREPENPWYLDEVMLDRFGKFCTVAEKYGMKLIVGLITGWMSGRLFIPSALNGKNLCTDPVALKFELLMVRGIVSRFCDRDVIYAWNLGNECNCMSKVNTREEAMVWTAAVSNSIRAADPDRPVISGMHSLSVDRDAWRITDQADWNDILTTHPYAYFVPYCRNDPIDSIRTLMHGTCETMLYASVGKKPCLVEELGTLGPNICNDDISGSFMRLNLISNWANGSAGLLWWCAHEQLNLETPPYNWFMLERELGMLDINRRPKPILKEMKKFSDWLGTVDFELEAPVKDALILLTKEQDCWATAFMSFILGKQAGVTLDFLAPNLDIPDSAVYFMPSVHSGCPLYARYYNQLLDKVYNGAVLYVSNGDAFFNKREEVFGASVISSEDTYDSGTFTFSGSVIPYERYCKVGIEPTTAQVLANDGNGKPIFTVNNFGKGKIYYLNFPLEDMLSRQNHAFDGGAYKIYEYVLKELLEKKTVRKLNSKVGVTENGSIATVINYSNEPVK